MPQSEQKIFIRSYGCQMNEYDAERMHDLMAAEGYGRASEMDEAGLILLNTCHIREKAAEKVYSELGRVRQVKARRAAAGKDTMIAVVGCVAQAEGAEMARRAPVIDLVIGPQSYHRLPQLLAEARASGKTVIDTEFPEEQKFGALPAQRAEIKPAAFLSVQEGCDKFCTFCVVPYTRGGEYSRPVADILAEARRMADEGTREITLLGQNVNAYHGARTQGGDASLAELLHELARIEGLERLRYTTSHPRDMEQDLIDAHRDIEKLMPYLHLPFQAGSDRILKAMNRKHTAEEYRELIDRIRAVRPDIALSTDIIVGFPGETDADFAATMDMVERVNYAQAYSFKYSRRPGTPASAAEGQVAEEAKTERLHVLQAKLKEQQTAFNKSLVGRDLTVLFERAGRLPGQAVGRSPYLQPVHVMDAASRIGEIVAVRVTGATGNSLEAVTKQASLNATMQSGEDARLASSTS